jgi:hypothetical protein
MGMLDVRISSRRQISVTRQGRKRWVSTSKMVKVVKLTKMEAVLEEGVCK